MRRAAVRNLGLINSTDSANALQSIYSKETDRDVRKEVLNAYFFPALRKLRIPRGSEPRSAAFGLSHCRLTFYDGIKIMIGYLA